MTNIKIVWMLNITFNIANSADPDCCISSGPTLFVYLSIQWEARHECVN